MITTTNYHPTTKRAIEELGDQLERYYDQGFEDEIDLAERQAAIRSRSRRAEKRAWMRVMLERYPGIQQLEWGETREIMDQYAAAPPSAALNDVLLDLHTCAYCDKVSKQAYSCCAQCRLKAYCSQECQKKHWKAHKRQCQPLDDSSTPEKRTLPLTRAQLEAFGSALGHRLKCDTWKMIEMTCTAKIGSVFVEKYQ
jgi:hypothetical protein